MKQATTRTLFAYWNAVRAGRAAPRRFDIEPSQISSILPETMVLERVDFETYRFRLAGTRICEDFGRELRGVNFVTLWPGESDRIALETCLSRVVRHCTAARIEFDAHDLEARKARFEMLILPLFHTGDLVDRLLGTITEIPFPAATLTRPLFAPRLVEDELIWPDRTMVMAKERDGPTAVQPNHTEKARSPLPFLAGSRDGAAGHYAGETERSHGGNAAEPPVLDLQRVRVVRANRRQFRVYEGGRED